MSLNSRASQCRGTWALLLTLAWLSFTLLGCAGGSVGTDNPMVAVVSAANPQAAKDPITVRVWLQNQNPLLAPNPLWDTTFSASSPLILKPKTWGNADTSWNIEATASDGSMDLLTNVRTNTAGEFVRNDSILSDTLHFNLKLYGLILTDTATEVTYAISSGIVADSSTSTAFSSSSAAVIVTKPVPVPTHLVVLGTSIVIPFTKTDHPDGSYFSLPQGTYTVETLTAADSVLASWQISVK